MPASSLGDRFPTDWILGNQIGVLAYTLLQRDRQSMAQPNFRSHLAESLAQKLEYAQERLHEAAIPIASLHFLAQESLSGALPRRHRALLAHWKDLYGEFTRGRRETDAEGVPKPSQANAAKLIAHQILYSDASIKSVVGALSTYLSAGFEAILDSDADISAFALAITTLRRKSNTAASHVVGITNLIDLLSKYSKRALLVRNALFDNVLAWPVVLFGEDEDKIIGAIAVPVAVDLAFDNRDHVGFRSVAHANSDQNIFDGWALYLRNAAATGKLLWRAKNGNSGSLWQKIEDASVSFDFTIIEKIFKGTPLRARFADSSMEAYFAQVVLAKAGGKYPSIGAAISGSIGEQRVIMVDRLGGPLSAPEGAGEPVEGKELDFPEAREEQTVLDWRFNWPQGVRQKKQYIYSSYKYNRCVLPVATEVTEEDSGKHEAYIETNNCRYLSDVADCVQVGGWRQFRYIRSPDVMHTLHKHHSELPGVETDEVQECLALLRAQCEPILKIPNSIGPGPLFAALHHINFTERLREAYPAPSLSWSVVRSVPEESNARFWHMILRRAIGASSDFENDLMMVGTPDEAASLIASALENCSGIPAKRAERPPELLVILGCRHHTLHMEDGLARLVQPLSFEAVIHALGTRNIRPVLSEKMQALLGRTRVILIDSDDAVGAEAPDLVLDDREDAEAIGRLSTFRNGFNFQMANSILWNLYNRPKILDANAPRGLPPSVPIREKLRSLVSRGFITWGGGWYCLRRLAGAQADLLSRRSDLAKANGHFFAGLGFAPYLNTRTVAGLNIAEAMLPDHVREAIFHFEEAAAYANSHIHSHPDDSRVVELKKQARLAQQRLMRFFDVVSWGVVTHLSRARKEMPARETYDLAKDLLEKWRNAKREPQPRAWTIAARAAQGHWDQQRRELETRRQRKDTEYVARHAAKVEKLFDEIIEMFEHAVRSAANSPSYRDEQLLNVSTHYSAFLHLHGKSRKELLLRRDQLDGEIWAFLDRNVTAYAPDGKWFEYVGDRCEAHADALRAYSLGCLHVPKWRESWVKALGCLALTGGDTTAMIDRMKSSQDVDIDAVCSWSRVQRNWSVNKMKLPWVDQRWNRGKGLLLGAGDQRPRARSV